MAVNKRPTFGVIFLGEHISLKNGTYCPLFSHDTTFFKRTCFLIRLKVLPDGLYGPHLYCYKTVPTYLMKRTVERQLGIESGSRKSVWKLKYLVQILKIFIPDTNKCNSILRNSGYTGLLRLNCPGFDSLVIQSSR
jgi:hypothetical protein